MSSNSVNPNNMTVSLAADHAPPPTLLSATGSSSAGHTVTVMQAGDGPTLEQASATMTSKTDKEPTFDQASAKMTDTAKKTDEAWYHNRTYQAAACMLVGGAIAFTGVGIALAGAVSVGGTLPLMVTGVALAALGTGIAMYGVTRLINPSDSQEKPPEATTPDTKEPPATTVRQDVPASDANTTTVSSPKPQIPTITVTPPREEKEEETETTPLISIREALPQQPIAADPIVNLGAAPQQTASTQAKETILFGDAVEGDDVDTDQATTVSSPKPLIPTIIVTPPVEEKEEEKTETTPLMSIHEALPQQPIAAAPIVHPDGAQQQPAPAQPKDTSYFGDAVDGEDVDTDQATTQDTVYIKESSVKETFDFGDAINSDEETDNEINQAIQQGKIDSQGNEIDDNL